MSQRINDELAVTVCDSVYCKRFRELGPPANLNRSNPPSNISKLKTCLRRQLTEQIHLTSATFQSAVAMCVCLCVYAPLFARS